MGVIKLAVELELPSGMAEDRRILILSSQVFVLRIT